MTSPDDIDDMIVRNLRSGDAPPEGVNDQALDLFRWRQPDASIRLVFDESPVGAARSRTSTALRWAAGDLAITIVQDPQSGQFVGTVAPHDARVTLTSVGDRNNPLDVSDVGMFFVPPTSGPIRFEVDIDGRRAVTEWTSLR